MTSVHQHSPHHHHGLNHYQHEALKAIHHYAHDLKNHSKTKKWHYVDLHRLVHQLETRVKSPDTVNQRKSLWCGPAAVCASMLKEAPTTYVNMVIDLVQHAQATVHHGRLKAHTLKASYELRNYQFPKNIADADWVPMATLRESLKSTSPHDTNWFFHHGTYPQDVMMFYQDLGYTKLEDYTSGNNMLVEGTLDDGLPVVDRANHLYRTKYRITMFINDDMLDGAKQGSNAKLPPQTVRRNHWVDLISPILVTSPRGPDSSIGLKVFSWGYEMAVPQDPPMTLREFASNFFGFIAAKY